MTSTDYRYAATDQDGDLEFTRAEKLRRLNRLRSIARLMDSAIRIPGTQIRFGADSVLGLIPVAGDAGGALVGLAIINEARKLGLPKRKIAKMVRNLGVDALVGSVPLVGDVFDVFFKAHRRNVQLVLDHFAVEHDELDRAERARPIN